jgi:5-methylcytosine-specific restriction endonuclease McrA
MVYVTGHETSHQPPEFTWQNIRFAVTCADDVACLDCQAFDFKSMDHIDLFAVESLLAE